jgi:hypothetical protein
MAKLGDTVVYTAAKYAAQGVRLVTYAAIVVGIEEDGSFQLCCFDAEEQQFEWLYRIRVTGAQPGTEEAAGFWSPR